MATASVIPGVSGAAAREVPLGLTGSMQTLANHTVFLQLLVAQLKNQSPDNPTDGTQFVTQLAQFVTLEQQTRATADLEAIRKLLEQAAPAAAQGVSGAQSSAAAPLSAAGQALAANSGSLK